MVLCDQCKVDFFSINSCTFCPNKACAFCRAVCRCGNGMCLECWKSFEPHCPECKPKYDKTEFVEHVLSYFETNNLPVTREAIDDVVKELTNLLKNY